MSKNYFSIERNGECWSPVVLADNNGNPTFEEFLNMSYSDMRSSEALADFVAASMCAADEISGCDDDQTIVTLIGEDDVFIWSIIMGSDPDEDDNIRYNLVDWKKDGKNYRYAPT